MIKTYRPCDIRLLVIIVDREQDEKVADILRSERVRFHFIALAEGTAGSEIMTLLGLDTIDKSFICCMEPTCRMPELLEVVSSKLHLTTPGKGIAFTMPISGLNSSVLTILSTTMGNNNEDTGESGGDNLDKAIEDSKYELIVSVVNHGFSDELMESARDAGATGGTIIRGRKLGVDDDSKFLGIKPQLEKEIVAILALHEQKNDIMRAITKACGQHTDARGTIFSLRVDDIVGLGKASTQTA
jgi:hypothetical protein